MKWYEVVDFGLLNSIVIGIWNSLTSHLLIIEILIIWPKKFGDFVLFVFENMFMCIVTCPGSGK